MRDREYDYESSVETETLHDLREKHDNRQKRGKKTKKLSNIHYKDVVDANIDFEELVDRVKKRLEKDLKDKLYIIKETEKEDDDVTKPSVKYLTTRKKVEDLDDKSEYIDEITDRTTKYRPKKPVVVVTERYEYADALETTYTNKNKKVTTRGKDYDEFKKIEMEKNDSYEDYKTPARDTNVYSSKENKRFKIKKSPISKEVSRKPLKKAKSQIYKQSYLESGEEVKARTENIVYDDYLSTSSVKDLKLGTFKPTREVYTIVTPNYVSPVGAERYDFDEPIPEKDREREHLKYFGNPPARINKKMLI